MTINDLIAKMTIHEARDALYRVLALTGGDPQHGDLAVTVDSDGVEDVHYFYDPSTARDTSKPRGWYLFATDEPSDPTNEDEFDLYPCQWNIGAAIKGQS